MTPAVDAPVTSAGIPAPRHGEHTIRLAADLDALDRRSLTDLQAGNLAATFAAIAAHPAARRHWFGDREPAHLRDLPLFRADDLARHCPPGSSDLVLDSAESGMVLRSSGTTGRRKVLYHSWAFNDRVAALGTRGARAGAGRHLPRRVAVCLAPAELNGAFGFAMDIVAGLGAQAYPVGSGMDRDELLEVMAEHRVDTLIASPGFATRLLSADDAVARLGHLERLWYIGENVGTERRALLGARLAGLRISSLAYSTSETGPIGYQCTRQHDNVHHVHDDVIIVEVVDAETGEPVPAGTEGDLAVTVLSDTGMPLLRYLVGDRVRMVPGRCPCGSAATRIDIIGRADQTMNIDSTTVSRDLVMAHLAPFGITDPATVQVQVMRDAYGFDLRLLVADTLPCTFTAAQARAELSRGYHLGRVFTSPTYRSFTVERVPPSAFANTGRGKTPFFIELPAASTDPQETR
jgi:phenylacetate-CoA ligase